MSNGFCRFCSSKLNITFADLGYTPLANSYLKEPQLLLAEKRFPLHAYVCEKCMLVQVEEFETPENIFGEYAYFSSFSESWLKHCKEYTGKAIDYFELNTKSLVVEIASNDGYMLQFFKEKGVDVLGIEPAANVATYAEQKGIKTICSFFGCDFGKSMAKEGIAADLIIANNVLAHVPDLNGFIEGMEYILKDDGVITIEVPSILNLIRYMQFDTIYHEHFSYFSLTTLKKVFSEFGYHIFDVERLKTHGGSLRIFLKKEGSSKWPQAPAVDEMLMEEKKFGIERITTYESFSIDIQKTREKILNYLKRLQVENKRVVGYGAPAKANTLLNYCGIGKELVEYTVDMNPYKQGTFLPGSHIPVFSPDRISVDKPDYVIIFPWNLRDEIASQLAYIKEWSGKLITLIPDIEVV